MTETGSPDVNSEPAPELTFLREEVEVLGPVHSLGQVRNMCIHTYVLVTSTRSVGLKLDPEIKSHALSGLSRPGAPNYRHLDTG